MSNTGAMLAYFLPPELANALHQLTAETLPDFAEPADQMHLTLVYFGEAADLSEAQIVALKRELATLAVSLSPLPGSINGIGRFVDNDPNAVIANFDASGLPELRASLITASRMAGVEPVLNHGFTPHVTLAYLPEVQAMPHINLKATPCALNAITLTLGDSREIYPLAGERILSEVAGAAVQNAPLPAGVDATRMAMDDDKELIHEISFTAPGFSFRDEAQYPDVPLAPGVDYGALTRNDPNPLFVTRPLAVLDAVSENGLRYDMPLITSIYQQVVSKKPAARQGHVSQENASWEFPDDAAIWVGALFDKGSNTLLGKAYIYPNTPFHQMVEKRKAAGSTLSNSIWGKGAYQNNPDGTMRCVDLVLETIDFAPMERAALGESIGGQFDTTAEMSTGDIAMTDTKTDVAAELAHAKKAVASITSEDVAEFFGEMTPEVRRKIAELHMAQMEPQGVYEMLPTAHRKEMAECYAKEMKLNMQPAAEMVGTVSEMSGLKSRVSEMETTIRRYERDDFERTMADAIGEQFNHLVVVTEEGKRKIAALKANLHLHVVAEMAGSTKKEEVKAAVLKAYESPDFKPLAETTIASMAGPSAVAGAVSFSQGQQRAQNGFDPATNRYDEDFANKAARNANYRAPRG